MLTNFPRDFVYFATWQQAPLAALALILNVLIIVWWRQQTRNWFRVAISALLGALILSLVSYYVFVTPPYFAGCPQGCPGWRGYPLPIASVGVNGSTRLPPVDFLLNTLMLWLLWLAASVVWQLLGLAFRWHERSLRARSLFVLFVFLLPWALLPRIINPPEPQVSGEDLRLSNNARRAAEFTYRLTGFWVQRLAVEDVRQPDPNAIPAIENDRVYSEVCLRGYTYFYLPWRRYRIGLDFSGVTALKLVELPLSEACW